jgi:hypothetical protein
MTAEKTVKADILLPLSASSSKLSKEVYKMLCDKLIHDTSACGTKIRGFTHLRVIIKYSKTVKQ